MIEIKLTPWLLQSIQSGDAILFLGAGASMGALRSDGKKSLNGAQLRDLLSDKFLGGRRKEMTLDRVGDYAKNLSSLGEVQSLIKREFDLLQPANFHCIIPRFRWYAIVTTNYDLVLERAYENTLDRLQNLAPIIRDGDNFSEKLSDSKLVPYLKLHGCITVINDPELPLILATEEYSKYQKHRTRLFSHLKDWGREHPIIFCGYDVADPNIQQILFDLNDLGISRPVYALVKPSLDDLDEAVWKSRRFETIKADFESFIDYLDYTISRHSRVLSTLRARDQLSITKWFKSKSQPPDELIHYLKTELEHIYGGMPTERVEPKHFYKGLVNSWGIFEQELDVRRRVTDDLLLNCILDKDASKVVRCFLLNGHAGSGKNITLRRTAWEAALEYEQLVLYLKEGGTLRRNQIFELCNIVGERITIFIDDAIQELENIVSLIDFAKKHNLQLTLIFGARTNEWNVYGEDLASHLEDEFDLRDLSESEISLLLTKLKQHKCLGHLASLTEEQRMAAFKIHAERQLLVALHEATSGKPFEKLVFDEYHNIVPTEARILYLDICTLHRLGAKVRAGLISRISGINFEMFKENLLRPLDHVVRIYEDRIIRDYIYRSRHSLIAKFVFEQALIKPEQRSEQIIRMLQFMNIDYRCDEEAFNELIKGKELAEIFADRSLPDQIYDTAEKIGANISHIRHQQAIFELNHPDGSIRRASEAIREAELNTKRGLSSICHTKAVIFRKAALETTHNLEREKYRKDAKEILHKQIGNTNDSYPFHTLGQVIIDEVRDKRNEYWIDRSQTENDRLQERTITDLISQAENIISQGLQTYPNDEYLLSLQADLSNILRDEPRAVQALERAFKNNPRSDVIATRLANHYARSENPDEAEKVLNRCLEQNPGSKRVHLLLSQIYMNQDEELHKNSISHHLKRSFTEGDVNYSAQMYYGRHMFLYGDMEEAERIFGNLRSQRFSPKQRNEVWGEVRNKDGSLTEYSGYVKYPYDSYCFVNISSLRRDIFIHHSQFKPKEWEEVRTNTPIRCNLAFTVRGVCGINPRIQN